MEHIVGHYLPNIYCIQLTVAPEVWYDGTSVYDAYDINLGFDDAWTTNGSLTTGEIPHFLERGFEAEANVLK